MRILIDNGHGEETPGKRSPDGRFREYKFAREIADRLFMKLMENGNDVVMLVPETEDIPLGDRCRRANKACEDISPKDALLVSIHVNAAGNGSKWLNATGWQAHTTPGSTKSDELAECLYESAEKILVGKKIRRDKSDGDSDYENNFYILKHTICPAVLTENFFQDSKKDVEFLESEEGKELITKLHYEGILNYIKKNEKTS